MEEAARKEVTDLLIKLGAKDWEEGAVDLLLGVACAEAAELLEGARRLSRNPATSPLTPADVRLAVDTRLGRPLDESEEKGAKRRREINEKSLPKVSSSSRIKETEKSKESSKRQETIGTVKGITETAHGHRKKKSHVSAPSLPEGHAPSTKETHRSHRSR